MADLQATFTTEGRLFFWTAETPLDTAVQDELPALGTLPRRPAKRQLTLPGSPPRRKRIAGFEYELHEVLPMLAVVPPDAPVSDSVRVWARATLLGLELASRQRVFPSVRGTDATWRALLARAADRERYSAICAALPTVARAEPTRARGHIKLQPSTIVVRDFLDATVDTLYRRGTYPGTARGWSLELAESLRGPERTFAPRDARYQNMPTRLAAWSHSVDVDALVLAVQLDLPRDGQDDFRISFHLHPADKPDSLVPVDDAWYAGAALELEGNRYEHPAHTALRALARAGRVFSPLRPALEGPRPCALRWDALTAWRFLSEGRAVLEDAGIRVIVPDAFDGAGQQRIRARIRIFGPKDDFTLDQALDFRWEVTLGERVIEGKEFKGLLQSGDPIVLFKGQWVLLDPNELARLPDGVLQQGQLTAAEALRAALVGSYQGVPVIADDRLQKILAVLREPPNALPPVGFRGRLRPYQKTGLAWLSALGQLGLGACLADDMGLGKTVQLIAHILRRWEKQSAMTRRPCLIVCPTSVVGNWEREFIRFAPGLGVTRYHGPDRNTRAFKTSDVVITTYGLLVRDIRILRARDWDVVALDEAQAIKNPDSRRARSAAKLKARHRVAMSGTPIENKLDELWSLFHFLIPGLLGPRSRFRRLVAQPIERFGDQERAAQLRQGIQPFLLRRLKTDPKVISDLPEKIERTEYTALMPEQAELYQRTVRHFMDHIQNSTDMERRGQVLAMLTALKQVCNHPSHYLDDDGPLAGRSGKLERTQEILDAIVARGEHTLVFTQYRQMGNRLKDHLQQRYKRPVPFLHGGTPQHVREEMVRSFQHDDDAAPIFLVSLRAGGTGLNLTRATHVIHYDRWWNPAVEDQATDRAFRIGQHDNVMVHKLVVQGTLEERIDAILQDKRQLAEQVVGGGERWVTELDDDALRELVMLGDDAVVEDA